MVCWCCVDRMSKSKTIQKTMSRTKLPRKPSMRFSLIRTQRGLPVLPIYSLSHVLQEIRETAPMLVQAPSPPLCVLSFHTDGRMSGCELVGSLEYSVISQYVNDRRSKTPFYTPGYRK
ncbi:hypothetical protein KIN20_004538 [Parelaphostrongylus tenuis]|uniref:Uncharacterized protein n=1 Tax=Parelaphostrongylus tenuis TaxID=148309 RepID=A0AAD5QGX0_PARTN|nr:hypothetical protein KIN20_004538 [Parelaphostrongylus tenuis]